MLADEGCGWLIIIIIIQHELPQNARNSEKTNVSTVCTPEIAVLHKTKPRLIARVSTSHARSTTLSQTRYHTSRPTTQQRK